jgi:hypothetical protein
MTRSHSQGQVRTQSQHLALKAKTADATFAMIIRQSSRGMTLRLDYPVTDLLRFPSIRPGLTQQQHVVRSSKEDR